METADNLSLRVASFSCYLDTAKDNAVRRVSALQQETSSTPTPAKPPFSIKFSKSKESQDDHHNRLPNNLSFPNYLNTGFGSGDDNNFVFEVPGPIQDPTSAFTFSHDIKDGGEIGVFGADRYFNMKLEYKTTDANSNRYKNNNNNIPGPENIIRPIRTPSLSSEASTCNSQAALLPDYNGISSQTKQHKRPIGRRNIFFTGFGCRGPCFDKKSVHTVAQGACNGTGSDVIDHHKIQVLKPVVVNVPTAKKQQVMVIKNKYKLDDQESRKSIEVFGSSNCSAKDQDIVAANMERKLSMLTWDAIISPKSSSVPPPTSKQSTVTCDDMASDASSDLFEIENISGSIYPLVMAGEDDDVMSTCMSPTISHYAPSEASIQWSVVTASAAPDHCSDYYVDDERSVSVAGAGDVMISTKGGNRKSKGLLGCKSAVDVADHHTSLCKKGNVDHKLVKS